MSANYWSRTLQSRVSRRRAITATGGASLAAAFLAACGSDSSTTTTPEGPVDRSGLLTTPVDETKNVVRGGTFNMIAPEFRTLDPMQTPSPWINRVYSELLRVKGGYMESSRGEIEGELAESWEFSPDKLQLTMKMSPKAKFHPISPVNGRAVDAEDVIFTYNRLKEGGLRRDELANDVNPSAPVVSVSAPDPRTVVFKLNEPNSSTLSLFATAASATLHILPREAADPNVLDLRREMVGSGPWMLKELVPSSRLVLQRNPLFDLDPRGLPYMDELNGPTIPEYSTGLSQFRSGALHGFLIRAEDILQTKRDVPALEMMPTKVQTILIRNFFGQLPESPFRDERVRQAWSRSWDRDLFIDVQYNVSNFEEQGLPMETRWSTALNADTFEGWWLDPRGKDFGPNAKFFERDIAEAKKLLSAAGHANGVDAEVIFPVGHSYGTNYERSIEMIEGMVAEGGFRPRRVSVNFNAEWKPTYQNGGGKFSGTAFVNNSSVNVDPGIYLFRFYNSKGSIFYGFDPNGQSTYAGDPVMDDLTLKMRREFDDQKRMALVHELQRHEGQKMYYMALPGGANSFTLAWPAVRNREVWLNDGYREDATLWLDQTKPPFRPA